MRYNVYIDLRKREIIMKKVTVKINGKDVILVGNRKDRRHAEKTLTRSKSESIVATVREYFGEGKDDVQVKVVNANPIHQRPPVKSWFGTVANPQYDDKMSAIIESLLFKGYSIGQIILHRCDEDDCYFIFESIDGGHRKRALQYFMDGSLVIKSPEGEALVWGSLTEEEQKVFLDMQITFLVYEGLDNAQKGDLFRTINESTHVNEQEQLNSYGNTDFANGIRGFVRHDIVGPYTPHPFFTQEKGNFVYKQTGNARLKTESLLTKISWLVLNKGLVAADFEDYSEMFNSSVFPEAALKSFLDKLYLLALSRKNIGSKGNNKLSDKEIRYFTFLHFYLGDYVIRNGEWDAFYDQFETAVDRFYDKNDPVWGTVISTEKGGVTKGKKIDTISNHWHDLNSMNKVAEAVKSNFPDFDSVVIVRSSKRSATTKDKETQFKNQGKVCEVERRLHLAGVGPEPKRTTISQCECAHIDLFCEGSSCELGDFYMIKKEHHKEQTKRNFANLDDFIEILISERSLKAA